MVSHGPTVFRSRGIFIYNVATFPFFFNFPPQFWPFRKLFWPILTIFRSPQSFFSSFWLSLLVLKSIVTPYSDRFLTGFDWNPQFYRILTGFWLVSLSILPALELIFTKFRSKCIQKVTYVALKIKKVNLPTLEMSMEFLNAP